MNKRIDKLAEQADLWNDMEPTRREGRYAGYMNVSDVEKFAELIVQEMLEITDAHTEVFQTDRDKALIEHIKQSIKQHFGVKE